MNISVLLVDLVLFCFVFLMENDSCRAISVLHD